MCQPIALIPAGRPTSSGKHPHYRQLTHAWRRAHPIVQLFIYSNTFTLNPNKAEDLPCVCLLYDGIKDPAMYCTIYYNYSHVANFCSHLKHLHMYRFYIHEHCKGAARVEQKITPRGGPGPYLGGGLKIKKRQRKCPNLGRSFLLRFWG